MAQMTPALSDEAGNFDIGPQPMPPADAQLKALIARFAPGDSPTVAGKPWGEPPPDNSVVSQLGRLPENIARLVSGWLSKSSNAATAATGATVPAAPQISAAPAPARPAFSAPAAAPAIASAGAPAVASSEATATSGPALSFNGPDMAPPAAAPAGSQARGLNDIYSDMIAKVNPQVNRQLDPRQQANAQKNFYLNLAAQTGGGPSGPNAFSRYGNAGLEQQKYEGAQEAINAEMDKFRITNERADVDKTVGFADKQSDNVRADKQLAVLEKHYAASDANAAEHMRVLREQLAQGKFDIKATPKGYVMIDKKTGSTSFMKGPDGRPIMPHEPGSTPSAEERIISHSMSDPDYLETVLKLKGKTGEAPEQAMLKLAGDMVKADVLGKTTLQGAMKTIQDEVTRYRTGASPAGNTVSRASPEYQSALKDPRVGGDKAKLDAALKKAGKVVAD